MAGDAERARINELAAEAKRAADAADADPELRSLLLRCHDALAAQCGLDAVLEVAAKMIESEPAIWPEEVERLQSLAARVRSLGTPSG